MSAPANLQYETSKRIILDILHNLKENERLIWAHRGFPNLGKHPCLIELDRFKTEGEPSTSFTQLETLERYPVNYRHIIIDGAFLNNKNGVPFYSVERIAIGKNDPRTTNLYCATIHEVMDYLESIDQENYRDLERILEMYSKTVERVRVFRKRFHDFKEESGN